MKPKRAAFIAATQPDLSQRASTPAHITVVFGRFNVNKQLRIHAPQKLPAVVAKHLGG